MSATLAVEVSAFEFHRTLFHTAIEQGHSAAEHATFGRGLLRSHNYLIALSWLFAARKQLELMQEELDQEQAQRRRPLRLRTVRKGRA